MSRRILIAGNWKMVKTTAETREFLSALTKRFPKREGVELAVCPPFTALQSAASVLKGSSIGLGAQDLFWEEEGAFTGEVSAKMLKEIGCRYVIIGHSERRHYFGETDETVHRKTKAALRAGLIPIVCIGETLAQREKGETASLLNRQIDGAFREAGKAAFSNEEFETVVIAYEPVWAIGTGKTATPAQAQEAHQRIRQSLSSLTPGAEKTRILYGGSVKPDNIKSLIQQPDLDGALVGGASLSIDSFVSIVEGARLEVQEKVS